MQSLRHINATPHVLPECRVKLVSVSAIFLPDAYAAPFFLIPSRLEMHVYPKKEGSILVQFFIQET